VFGNWPLQRSVVCVFEFLTPSTLGGFNFLNSITFLTIFSVTNAPLGGVQFLFRHNKQRSPTLGFDLLAHLSVWSLIDLTYNAFKKWDLSLFLNLVSSVYFNEKLSLDFDLD